MLKEFLWETFKKTGDIEVYIAYKELEERDLYQCSQADVEKESEENVKENVVVSVIS